MMRDPLATNKNPATCGGASLDAYSTCRQTESMVQKSGDCTPHTRMEWSR